MVSAENTLILYLIFPEVYNVYLKKTSFANVELSHFESSKSETNAP